MRPSPAEIVRTLVAGRLPGLVHLARRPGPHHARHVTDPDGRVLLLVPVASHLLAALQPVAGGADVAVVLDVLDLPPAAGAPGLGRAWVSGWAAELHDEEARRAALDFAAVEPTGDLLDVGVRFRLFRFEVAEVRWERAGVVHRIDPLEYAEAEPDPVHPFEALLLADLAERDAHQVTDYLRRQLGLTEQTPDGPPRVVRIDRYGLVVTLGHPGARRRVRLAFPCPVADPDELGRMLPPLRRPADARPPR
ncbi:DUF2470 domain-containing protein [Micromonospora sp. NPDC049274]|uniref:DUF2470 domain-containing protein n=1 Tax=Micromonospora sp. NPDC049274 TaxID=3154829 RepID=UPI0034364527